jgi:hypothetical protein
MNDVAGREYEALRATIRSRAGLRPCVFLSGLTAWAVLLVAVLVWLSTPLASVVPLLILVSTFEVVRMLHLSVERIGRYIQVFFEGGDVAPMSPPAWEHVAMAFGPSLPGAGGHPYFLPVFLMATPVNFLAVLWPGPVPVEFATLAVPHLAFVTWLIYCDIGMRKQRATELARFRALKEMTRPPQQ